ncbi:MAG TPA: aminotransferase class I/II-fold pyridoxal phosphate-dependent enzyme [Streptosporangiaceae bacterium]|nr:aminotransferase class I/II-fold pyridoxal phosphate-dependent enzyme [Streptosporangiaceae bacterium]
MSGSGADLALLGGRPVAAEPVRELWPRLTPELEACVLAQARDQLSVYDRSGVVAAFEDAFAGYVGVERALATSSGTAALHSLYYGAGIGPGDEVICCDYGFFATATPLLPLGATPVFVDCSADGTMSVDAAAAAITGETKAIMVTHMWGQPAQLDALRDLCDKNGLLLFEDCSHAHGARFAGRVVGSFGDGAAWSLQAHKSIWAGEGGVLVTSLPDVYERALLLGHFNLRAMAEIPESSPNFASAFTGTGLKYRAHPLGLALALPQIKTVDQLIEDRQKTAAALIEALRSIPGVDVMQNLQPGTVHGNYALAALIDPDACGFDRQSFTDALRAENIYLVSIPRQMNSLSHYPVFAEAGAAGRDGPAARVAGDVSMSERIAATAVKFFVPATSDDLTGNTSPTVIADAISKVGAGLPGLAGRQHSGDRP